MNEQRRNFLTRLFTGVVVAGTGTKVLGQIIPRITETDNPNQVQAEYIVDLTKFSALSKEYSSVSISNTGISSAPIIVMRIPNDLFVALENSCSHEGGRFGSFSSSTMRFTCSLHSAQFDLNGECTRGANGGSATLPKLTTYPVTYDKANNRLILNRIADVEDFVPNEYLVHCYPNPAFTDTTFEFGLQNDSDVKLELFDERGTKVATIVDEFRQAGEHQILFSVRHLPSGSYTYRLTTAHGFVTTRTLSVIH